MAAEPTSRAPMVVARSKDLVRMIVLRFIPQGVDRLSNRRTTARSDSIRRANNFFQGDVRAWTTAAAKDIEALFTPDAEYHEWPFETHWIGRKNIVEGWLSRQPWQAGGWTFDWTLLALTGDTAAISGTGVYVELGTFENLWTVTFGADGRCSVFRMWNNEV